MLNDPDVETMVPGKRRARSQSVHTADNCSCDHHNAEKSNLPWLPKKVRFSATNFDGPAQVKKLPSLLPLASPSSQIAEQLRIAAQGLTLPPSTQSVGLPFASTSSHQTDVQDFAMPSSTHSVAPTPLTDQSTLNANIDSETFRAQIRMNTSMMAQIESLRKEVDKASKERDFFKMKLSKANDQLSSFKKKNEKGKENVEPIATVANSTDSTSGNAEPNDANEDNNQ